MDYDFQWYLITRNWEPIVEGALVTYYVTILAMAIALVLGLVLALMRLTEQRWVSIIAQSYIEFLRSMPLYVFLLWIYFGLAFALDIIFEPLEAGILAVGLITAAYMAEIYRAGIMAVDRGQFEAARALGLNHPQIYRDVVLPQAFRIILPAAGNQFVGAFKGATIVAVIGVADLMYFAREASLQFFKPFEFYTAAGAILIASTLAFAGLVAIIERNMQWGK
jgi:His/Glu/Gln/Arg/opine family amino acid ABC transporter permease subunit